jgi:pimeloyl-ACP methyl ester carboxylesterase
MAAFNSSCNHSGERILGRGFCFVRKESIESQYEEAYVEVSGTRVHYLHAGSGRPMVLIHGLVGSSANWRRNIGALARHASVYVIDLVNMGKSQRIQNLDASLEATADRVAATMGALGVAEADIAGHSHGGAVALMLAARHPERVRSLLLFAPANPYSDFSDLIVRVYSTPWGAFAASMVPYLPETIQRVGLERMYGDPARIPAGCLQGYMSDLRVPGTIPHIMTIVRGWFMDMAKLKAALPQVAAVPTLLVWGDRDRAVSLASGRQLERELKAAEFIIVPGAGHVVFEEMPEASNRIMVEWLNCELVLVPRSAPPARRQRRASHGSGTATVAAMRRLSPGT